MLGPAFFVLLETSIKKGIRAALAFDAGVLISDIIYIVIAYVFIQQVEELSRGGDNALIRAIGGALFLVYGYVTFFKKVGTIEIKRTRKFSSDSKDYWILFIKGLLLNLANPLFIFFTIDVLKIVGAKQLRPFITAKLLRSLNRITGSILMGFGVFLVINSIVMWLR